MTNPEPKERQPESVGKSANGGQPSVLFQRLYAELKELAERELRHERPGHTLQPTALVHEAFAKLSGERRIEWKDRNHFLAEAAIAMRRILVDHARAANADKRTAGTRRVTLDENTPALIDPQDPSTIDLDEALNELAQIDARQANTVTLRYFGGCTKEETASVLGVSTSTVANDWVIARAWLRSRLATLARG